MVALGFLAAYALFRKRAARLGLNEGDASNLVVLLFGCGILGARIYYVIWNWHEQFARAPVEIVMIQHGGLVSFGGILGACTALVVWARVKRQSLASLADALAAPFTLGHAFGRIGCFMNGCCYGLPCDLPWAVQQNSPPEIAGIPVHPTQIYEFIGLLDIFVALLVIERIRRYPGQVAWAYCILYSILRFVVEFFRGDVAHDILGRFTLAQVACAIMLIVAWIGSARMAWRAARGKRAAVHR